MRWTNEALEMGWSIRWEDNLQWLYMAQHIRDYTAGRLTASQLREKEIDCMYIDFFPLLAEEEVFCGIL